MANQLTPAQRWLWPLFSRKFQVALAAAVVSYFTAAGVEGVERWIETTLQVVGVITPAAALIVGIAKEDAAQKLAK